MNRFGAHTLKRLVASTVVTLVLGASLAACGNAASPTSQASNPGSAGTASSTASVRIVAKDNVFEPAAYTVTAGQPVKVTFVNEGKNVHEFEVKGLIPETKIQPGESREFTVTPEKKTYELYCEIHEDQGMKGTFTGK